MAKYDKINENCNYENQNENLRKWGEQMNNADYGLTLQKRICQAYALKMNGQKSSLMMHITRNMRKMWMK